MAITLYLVTSTISLILTYAGWIWEHDADFYAVKKVGVETFTRALVKVYLTSYLHKETKYLKLRDSTISIQLNGILSLTWFVVFKELSLQALLARGFIDIIAKPLKKTHPPLYLRLRALRIMF